MTCWEMAWLVKHGRIALKLPVSDWLSQVEENGIAIIPVTRSIAERAVSLPEHTKTQLIASSSPPLSNTKRNCLALMGIFRIIRNWLGCWCRLWGMAICEMGIEKYISMGNKSAPIVMRLSLYCPH
jgi:hypothetical protein